MKLVITLQLLPAVALRSGMLQNVIALIKQGGKPGSPQGHLHLLVVLDLFPVAHIARGCKAALPARAGSPARDPPTG